MPYAVAPTATTPAANTAAAGQVAGAVKITVPPLIISLIIFFSFCAF